jgi:xanthine dehydrogenase accessory factor
MKRPGDGAPLALIRGAGDLATGIALSLHHAGFGIVMTEIARPTAIRRTVAFCQAVFDGRQTVEDVTARLCEPAELEGVLRDGNIAVVVDPESAVRAACAPVVAVDAILAKRNLGTTRNFAPIVIGCGPGFRAGGDVDAVIETMRGHELGRIILSGSAQEDTGVPGEIGGRTAERILRAPASGPVTLAKEIGDLVSAGELVMMVGDAPVNAPLSGCIRGLISEGLIVPMGLKVGDIDPRGDRRYCFVVSDKARAVGRAALEAALIVGRARGLLAVTRLPAELGP